LAARIDVVLFASSRFGITGFSGLLLFNITIFDMDNAMWHNTWLGLSASAYQGSKKHSLQENLCGSEGDTATIGGSKWKS